LDFAVTSSFLEQVEQKVSLVAKEGKKIREGIVYAQGLQWERN
jgi:hypothetical protein